MSDIQKNINTSMFSPFNNMVMKINNFIVKVFNYKIDKFQKTKVDKFQSNYYEIRAKLDNNNSRSFDEYSFLSNIENKNFHDKTSNPFKRLCGVLGGGYAILDKPQNKIFFIQNKYLKKDQNQDIPFYRLPYHIDLHPDFLNVSNFDQKTTENIVVWVLDTLYESIYDNMELVNEEKKAPDFFKNMPPFESSYSFEPLPFERQLRNKNSIDGLYCYAGEILFFLYAWRLLLYYAQRDGFDASMNINLSTVEEKTDLSAISSIWEKSAWAGVSDITPEKKWFNKLRENEKWWDEKHNHIENIPSIEQIDSCWNSIRKYTDPKNKLSFSFIDREWELLGLKEGQPYAKLAKKALRYYMRHILRQIKFPPDSSPSLATFPKTLDNVSDINSAIDFIISQDDQTTKEQYIEVLFSYKKSNEYWHYIYRKIIYTSLIHNNTHAAEKSIIGEILKVLHYTSRFPIMPLFFQIALSENRMPREFFVCPIAKSFS